MQSRLYWAATGICFNTVAILFVAGADNMAYHLGLAEPQKARMETVGRVILTSEDSQRLQQTKIAHIPVIIVGVLISVSSRSIFVCYFSGHAVLFIAELVRVIVFEELRQKPKGAAFALARLVGGFMAYLVVELMKASFDGK